MRSSMVFIALLGLGLFLSCSDDDEGNLDPPEGLFRLVDRNCFCGRPEEGTVEYWIFDGEQKLVTIRILNAEEELQESRELFYDQKGNNLIIGDGAEFVQKRKGALLELTYLDNPRFADDELVLTLTPY